VHQDVRHACGPFVAPTQERKSLGGECPRLPQRYAVLVLFREPFCMERFFVCITHSAKPAKGACPRARQWWQGITCTLRQAIQPAQQVVRASGEELPLGLLGDELSRTFRARDLQEMFERSFEVVACHRALGAP
jgi:hypothetical protein